MAVTESDEMVKMGNETGMEQLKCEWFIRSEDKRKVTFFDKQAITTEKFQTTSWSSAFPSQCTNALTDLILQVETRAK